MIKRKKDIPRFLKDFEVFAEWDGSKFYFVFQYKDYTITLMKYPDGQFTIHRKTETWNAPEEDQMTSEELILLLWDSRKSINQNLKVRVK